MNQPTVFEVIIIGGSYAGLSAAMALGRAMRQTLVLDGGQPCNRFAPHSHNFLTQDGKPPAFIVDLGKAEVLAYPDVSWKEGIAVEVAQSEDGFRITTHAGVTFTARKLILATGVKDILPAISGLTDCWGRSVIHCPYCHGYEYRHEKTGILADGEAALHYAQLLRQWTDELTLFTNGATKLTQEEQDQLKRHKITIISQEISTLLHEDGCLRGVLLRNGAFVSLNALYVRPQMEQQVSLAGLPACELTETGLIKVDQFMKTTVPGMFACGDNASPMRSVANAVAAGNLAGAMVNHELCAADF